MSNLLSEKIQLKIRQEYRARFILTGSSLAIAAAVFTALSLSPSFGVLFVTRPAALEEAHQVQQSKADSTDISRAQNFATVLAPISSASSSVSSALLAALAAKPAGVHIDTITYTSGVSAALMIGGIADGRTNIDAFRAQLQNNPTFSTVKLPVGDLVGGQGGRFTVTLTGNF